jgi:hypothetical protein
MSHESESNNPLILGLCYARVIHKVLVINFRVVKFIETNSTKRRWCCKGSERERIILYDHPELSYVWLIELK